MTRQKKSKYLALDVLKELEQSAANGATTIELAEALRQSRQVTSLYLSQLVQEGLVVKTGTKPVYYHSNNNQDVFEDLIGYDGSLKEAVEGAKAAVVYPPNGFPLMITGSSGVGKSYLAHLIFKYAKEQKVIKSDGKFVSLNCADYANNPELLSSVLFGHKKGSFTGASNDVTGLVEQADGGYLFLDEIHRLPKENQEKLFTLLDTGEFYPLGERKEKRTVNVRFLFATTEDLNHYLLTTFTRRVPMSIHLPDVSERSYKERLKLLQFFFVNEARQMNTTMKVGSHTIDHLLNQSFDGNVGTLANEIKVLCARAYQEKSGENALLVSEDAKRETDWLFIEVDGKAFGETNKRKRVDEAYTLLLKQLKECTSSKISLSEVVFNIQSFVRFLDKEELLNRELQVIGLANEMAEKSRSFISKMYGVNRKLSPEHAIALASFLTYLADEEVPMDSNVMRELAQSFPRSIFLTKKLIGKVRHWLGDLTDKKLEWCSVLLTSIYMNEKIRDIEKVKMSCLLLSHGPSMSTSIQEVVNTLAENYVFDAFDMPVEVSIGEIAKEVKSYLNEMHIENEGVILLFDMGSLSQMYKVIKAQTNDDLLVINNLTTAMALDVALQVINGRSFKEIADQSTKYGKSTKSQYYEGISLNKNIVVSCMSGLGLSMEIKNLLEKFLHQETEIITMDYRQLKTSLEMNDVSYFKNTKLILTTTDFPQESGVPSFNVYNIMESDYATAFSRLLIQNGEEQKAIDSLLQALLEFFTVEGVSARLQFLNPAIVTKEVQEVIAKYEQYYQITIDGKSKLSLYMHIALMLERLITSSRNSKEATEKEQEPMDTDKAEFHSISKNIFHAIEMKYNIVIDRYELSLIYELLQYAQK